MNKADALLPDNRPFTPTVRQLRAFAAVYQLRKLSAAAEQLFITQSAVSVMIRQMEDGLGARLFDRTTRSLQPTQAAREAIVVAERILRDVDSLGAGLRDLGDLRRGRLSLAVTPTLGEILLPRVLMRFAVEHPGIQVLVDDGIGTPERAAAGVDTVTLLRDHLSLVCAADHPLARRKQVRWAQLAGHPVITVRPGYGIRPLIDSTAARAGVRLDVVNEVSFLSTALWMSACGLGASIMPSAYATLSADPLRVVRPLTGPRVSRDIMLVTRRGRSLSPAAQGFVDVMRAEMGALAAQAK
jgi:DNA-binding transcriptional LysR family regulator